MTTSQRIRRTASQKKTGAIRGNKRSSRRTPRSEQRLARLGAGRTRKLKSLEREKILVDMVRSASIAIDIAYPDGHVSHCNPAFFELVGYTEEELPNINWIKLTPPEFHDFEGRKRGGSANGESCAV